MNHPEHRQSILQSHSLSTDCTDSRGSWEDGEFWDLRARTGRNFNRANLHFVLRKISFRVESQGCGVTVKDLYGIGRSSGGGKACEDGREPGTTGHACARRISRSASRGCATPSLRPWDCPLVRGRSRGLSVVQSGPPRYLAQTQALNLMHLSDAYVVLHGRHSPSLRSFGFDLPQKGSLEA